MRKPIALISLLLVVALGALIAGCGGGDDGAGSPLDSALSYLPQNTPFAVAISTDVDGGQFQTVEDTLGQTDVGRGIGPLLRSMIEGRTGDLEQLEEALGNPFVVGSTDPQSFIDDSEDEDTSFVAAIQASSGDALDKLVESQKAQEDGEVAGATIYKDDSGDPFAIDGDVLVVAGSRAELEAALERSGGEEHLTEETFESGIGDLPEDALVRVYLDIAELLLASDDAKDALEVKWVEALRTAGIALAFEDDQLAIDFNVITDPDGLTEDDLPIATGADSPQVLDRGGQIMVALRDPAQVVDFARSAAASVDPDGAGALDGALAQIEKQADVDLQRDLFGQLAGNLAVAVDLDGSFGARGDLEDPAAFERTLGKLSEVLPEFARGAAGERVGFAEPKPGEDFYAIATASGTNIVFGVVDGTFVLANDPGLAGQLAAADTEAVDGAEGALVVQADAFELLRGALRQTERETEGLDFSRLLGGDLDGALGDLTGSLEASTESMSGRFTLTLPSGGDDGGDGDGSSGGDAGAGGGGSGGGGSGN